MIKNQSNCAVNINFIAELENILNYKFENHNLLLTALTHRSLSSDNYERLEFLGDSVLSLIIARYLYCHHKDLLEGELSKQRSNLVNHNTLAAIAKDINLEKYVLLGGAEKKYDSINTSILSDVMESIIAAVFLDCNDIETVNEIILRLFSKYLNNFSTIKGDYKTVLQELLQARRIPLPNYEVISEAGPPHNKLFTVKCTIPILELSAESVAKTKKEASQLVAAKIIDLIYD
jgi:ribonuclease-3